RGCARPVGSRRQSKPALRGQARGAGADAGTDDYRRPPRGGCMRIRSIKPEFWRSDDIAGLAVEDRLLFIGLWSYVDDNGVGPDRLALIAADLFAADLERAPRETFARVSRGLSNLSEAGLIVRYEVQNRAFLEVVNWS